MLGYNFETPNVIDAGDLPPSRPNRNDDADRPGTHHNGIPFQDSEDPSLITKNNNSPTSIQRLKGTKILFDDPAAITSIHNVVTPDTRSHHDEDKKNLINKNNNNNDNIESDSDTAEESFDDEEVSDNDDDNDESEALSHALRLNDARYFAASILSEVEEHTNSRKQDGNSSNSNNELLLQGVEKDVEKDNHTVEYSSSDWLSPSINESVSSFITRTRNTHYWRKRNAKRRYFIIRSFIQAFILLLCFIMFVTALSNKNNNSNQNTSDYDNNSNTVALTFTVCITMVLICVLVVVVMECRENRKANHEMERNDIIYNGKQQHHDTNDSLMDGIPQRQFQSSTLTAYPILLVGDTTAAAAATLNNMTNDNREYSSPYESNASYMGVSQRDIMEASQRDEDGNHLYHIDL